MEWQGKAGGGCENMGTRWEDSLGANMRFRVTVKQEG
jgi:hypothetical protein